MKKTLHGNLTEQQDQPQSASVEFLDPSGLLHNTGLCERNLNLLAHAQAIELEIGSICGGHGVCGGDRICVAIGKERLSAVTENERIHLSSDEITQGWRLACQCFPEQPDGSIRVVTSY